MVVSILFIVCSLSAVSAANKTITAGDEGGIRDVINNNGVNSGDTIFLQPGTYDKTGNDTNFTISKSITLQGNGSKGSVVIDAKGMSRIFTMGGGINVIFINIKFINGKTTGNGGAILNNAGSTMMTFINCSFVNNTITPTNSADGKGGAIYNGGNYAVVANSSFINNKAVNTAWYDAYGGAIYNTGNNFTVNNNSHFINNTAYDGGVIYNTGNNFTVANSTFEDNNAIVYGGAIHNTMGANFIVANSIFTNNAAIGIPGSSSYTGGYGGAIYNSGLNFIVANSTFTANKAIPTGSTNTVGGYGGAIMDTANNFTVKNSTFINNAGNFGAGIYIQGTITTGIDCTVDNSTFINNTANGGAAIQNSGYHLIVNNANFINNTANTTGSGYGGAISNSGNYVTVANSTFTDNKAITGGAIRNTGVNFTITNSNFVNNVGNNGGAVYNIANNSTVSKSTFIGNTANANGGGIYNQGNMSVSGNTMTNNKATLGNAIYNAGNMGILNLTYLNNGTIKIVKGQNVTLFATLTDDMGNNVTGKNISFVVNGTTIGNVTFIEGYANINYTVPDFEGLLTVSGDYTGHANYQITLLNGQLRALTETNSTINTPNNVKVSQKINITGTATDKDENPIANTIINVIVNGKTYTVTTDDNGDWSLLYTPIQAGIIDVSVKWDGNNTLLGFINNTSFNVGKSITNSTIVVLPNVKAGQKTNISGVAKDEFGNILANTVLKVVVNGSAYTVTTDSNGKWILSHTPTKVGNMGVFVSWEGNDSYFGFINNTSFDVAENDFNIPVDNKTNTGKNENETDTGDNEVDDTNENSSNPVAAKTLPMKNTGMPIICILLLILAIFSINLIERK